MCPRNSRPLTSTTFGVLVSLVIRVTFNLEFHTEVTIRKPLPLPMVLTFLYKIICLLVGLTCITLGYRLFVKGIFNESGDLESSWKSMKLIVRKAAPGTYFVLFGSLIIAFTIYKGLEFTDSMTADNSRLIGRTPDLSSIFFIGLKITLVT